MASEPRNAHVPEGIDPDASPFENPGTEALPLTKAERATLERVIRELAEGRETSREET